MGFGALVISTHHSAQGLLKAKGKDGLANYGQWLLNKDWQWMNAIGRCA